MSDRKISEAERMAAEHESDSIAVCDDFAAVIAAAARAEYWAVAAARAEDFGDAPAARAASNACAEAAGATEGGVACFGSQWGGAEDVLFSSLSDADSRAARHASGAAEVARRTEDRVAADAEFARRGM